MGIYVVSEVLDGRDIPKTFFKWWLSFLVILVVIIGTFSLLIMAKNEKYISEKVILYLLPIYIAMLFGGPIAFALVANRIYRSEWTLHAAIDCTTAQQDDATEPASPAH